MKQFLTLLILLATLTTNAQRQVKGSVLDEQTNEPLAGALIYAADSSAVVVTDAKGKFSITLPENNDRILISAIGYELLEFNTSNKSHVTVLLVSVNKEMDAVVVTGTMRAVRKLESPIAVEVYTPQFLKRNPSASVFEALQNVNGVRPQLNCNVCSTGDIHINGLEGPYTMVTIDGMPIVSSLASVYGLFGIPTQLIDRIEIVKGPASGLYGSEAIGGLINIITKSPEKAPRFTANLMTTSWLEHMVDLGYRWNPGKKISVLTGLNYFNYQQPFDKNEDQFTDVTLQHRISVFNKLSFERSMNRHASLAARYFYEDRWGGDMRWNENFRGGDSIYGESIYTSRWELIGNYQLPVHEKIDIAASATGHDQNSYYGKTAYMAKQKVLFGQLTWSKPIGVKHNLLSGLAARYNYYDDNSTATLDTLTLKNTPEKVFIPGIFVQDEWKISPSSDLLTGLRYDYHPAHGSIITPRIAFKLSMPQQQVIRINAGTGFRVVNLFTEDHAALTGARAVEIEEKLDPEKSYNVNLNYSRQWKRNNVFINLDASMWYSYFNNQIIPVYTSNKIIYRNLDGHSTSKGATVNLEFNLGNRFKTTLGATFIDVEKVEVDANGNKTRQRPLLTENWSGVWSVAYTIPGAGLTFDYTGNIYGPMLLPLTSSLDPRSPESPVWSIQNIQVTKRVSTKVELYAGVKNLLNWTPVKSTPFLISRSQDPFNKDVQFDQNGNAIATSDNPYGLIFDPSYVYAPNQGMRAFAGVRLVIR